MKEIPKIPFPYRPKKRKKDWVVGHTGKNIGDHGVGFGNPVGDGGSNGGGIGESVSKKDKKFLYNYSCAMLNLPESMAPILRHWAKKMIPKDSLYVSEDEGIEGLEDMPHVTIKYGLHDTTPDEVKKLSKGFGKIKIKLGDVTKFEENPNFDVLKIDISGDKLKELNKILSDNMEHSDKFDKYTPHATLAYIKKGCCKDLVNNDFFKDLEDEIDEIYFTSRTGEEYYIGL